jgi:hypothetical protein
MPMGRLSPAGARFITALRDDDSRDFLADLRCGTTEERGCLHLQWKGVLVKTVLLAALVMLATPALAQDSPNDIAQDKGHNPAPRDLCSELGGLDTPACIVDPNRLQVELGMTDWTLDRTSDQRKDTIDVGDVLMRYGVTGTTELRLGWTAFGYARTRDWTSGDVDRTSGIGDVTLGVKQSLSHPPRARPASP